MLEQERSILIDSLTLLIGKLHARISELGERIQDVKTELSSIEDMQRKACDLRLSCRNALGFIEEYEDNIESPCLPEVQEHAMRTCTNLVK